jgi:hypothetical protein
MKNKKDELEKYRKLLDDTLKSLDKIYKVKKNKINPFLTALGIILVGLGGTVIMIAASSDYNNNSAMITPFGIVSLFIGLCITFIGYIISHKGLKGSWL